MDTEERMVVRASITNRIGHHASRLRHVRPNDKSSRLGHPSNLITSRHGRISSTNHPRPSPHSWLLVRLEESGHPRVYSTHRCRCSDCHPRRTQLPPQQRGIGSTVPVISRFRTLSPLQMIHYESHETLSHVLTPEGAQISLQGSHEARVWAALPGKGAGSPVTPAELKKIIGDESAKVGQGRAFKNGWIAKDRDGLVKAVRHQRPAPRRNTSDLCFSWLSRYYQ